MAREAMASAQQVCSDATYSTLPQDCGFCINCIDKPKFGGTGRRKQTCLAILRERRGNPNLGEMRSVNKQAKLDQTNRLEVDETATSGPPERKGLHEGAQSLVEVEATLVDGTSEAYDVECTSVASVDMYAPLLSTLPHSQQP